MTKNVIDFKAARSDFELLDKIRIRYQMYAEDIQTLGGLLVGYCLAQVDYKRNIRDFASYLANKKEVNPLTVSWMEIISSETTDPNYEIPVFFQYLDEYREISYDQLGSVKLSWEQRYFDFHRQIENVNIDFPRLPLKAPHKLEAVKIPGVKVHAFYYDENGVKYYEQCLGDYDNLKSWAKECFNIDETQWIQS